MESDSCRFRAASEQKFAEDLRFLKNLQRYKRAGYPFGRDDNQVDRASALWARYAQRTTLN